MNALAKYKMFTKKTLIFGFIILCLIHAAFAQSKNTSKAQCSSLISSLISVEEIKKVYLQTIDNSSSSFKNKISPSEETDFFNIALMTKINSIESLSLEDVEALKTKLPEIKSKTIYVFTQRLKKDLPLEKWFDDSSSQRCRTLFSLAEIKKLSLFFENEKGKKIAQILNKTIIFAMNKKEMIFSKDEKILLPDVDKFADTRLGQKLVKTLIVKGVLKDLEKSLKDWLKIQPSAFEIELPQVIKEILAADNQKIDF